MRLRRRMLLRRMVLSLLLWRVALWCNLLLWIWLRDSWTLRLLNWLLSLLLWLPFLKR